MDLAELFELYGTDKGCYAGMYHALFKHIRHLPLAILEVGIGTLIPSAPSSMAGYAGPAYRPGGSLRVWRDYFPKADVFGLDIQSDTQLEHEARIQTSLTDSTRADHVDRFIASCGGVSFDIVIDDGSHQPADQLATLRNLYPHVKEGGYYIIEDTCDNGLVAGHLPDVTAICGGAPLFTAEDRRCVVISRPA